MMDDSNRNNGQNWQFTFVGGIDAEREDPFSPVQIEESTLLAKTKAGDRVWIVGFQGYDISHLLDLGLVSGAELQVISCLSSGSVIVDLQGRHLGLGANTACQILVTKKLMLSKQSIGDVNFSTYLRDLPVGARGYVVGFDRVFLGYTGKLLAMGLKPGTVFTVLCHAFSHLVEIEGQGLISLQKQEADALCVEEVEVE